MKKENPRIIGEKIGEKTMNMLNDINKRHSKIQQKVETFFKKTENQKKKK